MCVHMCVCVCARARVRARACACVRVFVCVRASISCFSACILYKDVRVRSVVAWWSRLSMMRADGQINLHESESD